MSSSQNPYFPSGLPGGKPGGESDILVVVGGKEFQENSHALRAWSQYFDAAYRRSEMKDFHKFEFQDKDPEEWELVKAVAGPFSQVQVTKDNVLKVLPWFSELQCLEGLRACDNVIVREVSFLWPRFSPEGIEKVLNFLEISVQCNLMTSLVMCLLIMICVFRESVNLLTMEHLKAVVSLLAPRGEGSVMCHQTLWIYLEGLLPADFPKDQGERNALIQCNPDLLPILILSEVKSREKACMVDNQWKNERDRAWKQKEWELKAKEKEWKEKEDQQKRQVARVIAIAGGMKAGTHVRSLRQNLARDEVCGGLFPEDWQKKPAAPRKRQASGDCQALKRSKSVHSNDAKQGLNYTGDSEYNADDEEPKI